MKKIAFLFIFLITAAASFAQGVNRGAYGTMSPYNITTMKTTTPAGVVKSSGKDTLTNGDTGYVWVFAGQGFDMSFDLYTTTLTGTVATTSNILYGVNNNGAPLSAAQVATVTTTGTSYALTGNTTYCTTCVGASSTTVPGASKHYLWEIPNSKGALFDNYVIRTIQTGTCTATYTGKIATQY